MMPALCRFSFQASKGMLERRETKAHQDGLEELAPQEIKETWVTKDRKAVWVAMEKSDPSVLKVKKEILVI